MRPGSPSGNVNRQVMRTLGAGSGIGAGLGAGKTRIGATSPGLFNTLSLQDIRRMSTTTRARVGSVSGTHSFTSSSGLHAANPSPVALTNLRARPTSLDSYKMNAPVARSSSSVSGSSKVSTRGEVAVPQPVATPHSGWHDMPPWNQSHYYIPSVKDRPIRARRNLPGDRALTRSASSTSLNSLDSSSANSRPGSQLSNEGGSFLPQVREDFKLHNRLGDLMRTFSPRHPYLVKAGRYVGGGLAGLGAYIAASQIDRAIQRGQDEADDKTAEKHKNLGGGSLEGETRQRKVQATKRVCFQGAGRRDPDWTGAYYVGGTGYPTTGGSSSELWTLA